MFDDVRCLRGRYGPPSNRLANAVVVICHMPTGPARMTLQGVRVINWTCHYPTRNKRFALNENTVASSWLRRKHQIQPEQAPRPPSLRCGLVNLPFLAVLRFGEQRPQASAPFAPQQQILSSCSPAPEAESATCCLPFRLSMLNTLAQAILHLPASSPLLARALPAPPLQ